MYITSEIREELYKTWQLLLSAKSIVLTSHIDPDGDAIVFPLKKVYMPPSEQ